MLVVHECKQLLLNKRDPALCLLLVLEYIRTNKQIICRNMGTSASTAREDLRSSRTLSCWLVSIFETLKLFSMLDELGGPRVAHNRMVGKWCRWPEQINHYFFEKKNLRLEPWMLKPLWHSSTMTSIHYDYLLDDAILFFYGERCYSSYRPGIILVNNVNCLQLVASWSSKINHQFVM